MHIGSSHITLIHLRDHTLIPKKEYQSIAKKIDKLQVKKFNLFRDLIRKCYNPTYSLKSFKELHQLKLVNEKGGIDANVKRYLFNSTRQIGTVLEIIDPLDPVLKDIEIIVTGTDLFSKIKHHS